MATKQEEAFNLLASKFPARYRARTTKYLAGLLQALAEGDAFIATQVEAVRDNLLVLTATGKNLDRLASIYGVIRGTGTGVQDSDFRLLVPVLGMSPKQITHSLQKVIDVIYGPYASHANSTCSAPAPYKVLPNTRLKVRVDDQDLDIEFRSSDAIDLSQASAQEIATAISEHTQGKVIGSVVTNTRTGEQFVNIRTATIGSQGFIQVLGGDAQIALRFPEVRPTRQDIATWQVTRFQGTDELVFTATSGISPGMRTAGVRKGDFVTIRADSGLDPKNTGSFEVSFVEENSFRAKVPAGVPESGVTQNHVDDFVFYRPDLGNILLSARPASVLQTSDKELTVILPVTSPIVKKTLRGSHHFHGGMSSAVSSSANTLTLASTNGFPNQGAVLVIGSRRSNEGTVSSVGAGTITLVDANGWPASGAAFSPVTQKFYFYNGRTGNVLSGVSPDPLAPAPAGSPSLTGSPLKFSDRFSYTGIVGNTLIGVNPNPSSAVGFELTSDVVTVPDFPGSFLYDQASSFEASHRSVNLDETIEQGSSRTVISVSDLPADLPQSGYFVLEFATREQEGPVKYQGKIGSRGLLIDPSHVFVRDHLKGTRIRFLKQIGPYIPQQDGRDYPVYLTATSAARSLVLGYLANILAAGISLRVEIQVPEQKWSVLPLLHADNPTDQALA